MLRYPIPPPDTARPHRFTAMQRVIGILLMLFSLTMVPPIFVDMLYENSVHHSFLVGLWITLATGALLWFPVRRSHAELKTHDGFLITVLFWAVLAVFGSIPLHVTDIGWHTWTDAVFESMSGLTTTGATVVPSGLDNLPHAINYYRAQLHFFGGMGIVVLAVAILPILGVGGMQLYKAETPGPMKDNKLTPRIASTARALWIVYVSLTAVCAVAFWLAGMPAFDAIVHAMSALGTGGFSSHDASIGYFNSPLIEWVVMLFMFIGALNFATHFAVWRSRNFAEYWRDVELRTCLAIIGIFTALTLLPLITHHYFGDWWTALRKALFHVISYGSTTGFATDDTTAWPGYVPMLLLLSMFMIGCAGSTAGGVKVVRLMLFVKQAQRELYRLVHPSAEAPIKLGGKVVPDPVVYAVGGFFSVYIGLTIFLSFLLMTTGLDALTAFSAVAACINNAGPGHGELSSSMATVSLFGKWVLIFAMLLGRLEIFSLLVLFTPAFWRR